MDLPFSTLDYNEVENMFPPILYEYWYRVEVKKVQNPNI